MAETFLIKHTSFDDASSSTEKATKSFVIAPGELNGPGGVRSDTDLDLYGFGSVKWGEGVNQNLYRLLENFACPQKVAGDAGFDANKPSPKDENQLGIGNGITNPIIGQRWFNVDNEVTYVYTSTGWFNSAAGDITLTGNLDMSNNKIIRVSDATADLDALNRQTADSRYVSSTKNETIAGNKTFSGTIKLGLNDLNANSRNITDLADPRIGQGQDAATATWTTVNFVNLGGDTMAGNLDFNSVYRITNLTTATNPGDAVSLQTGDDRYVRLNGGTKLTSDIVFDITPTPASSDGIKWSGNSDIAKIFVESYGGTEDSRLVFHISDNGDVSDYISFRSTNGVVDTETMRIKGTGISAYVPFSAGTFAANNATITTDINTPEIKLWRHPSNSILDGSLTSTVLRLKDAIDNNPVYIFGGADVGGTKIRMQGNSYSSSIGFQRNGVGIAQFDNLGGTGTTGRLDMKSNRIENLKDPVDDQDAATKSFVLNNAYTVPQSTYRVDPFLKYYGDGSNASFSSTGNFTERDNTASYTNFTLNAGHTMTIRRAFTIIRATGTITISGIIRHRGEDLARVDTTAKPNIGPSGGGGAPTWYASSRTYASNATGSTGYFCESTPKSNFHSPLHGTRVPTSSYSAIVGCISGYLSNSSAGGNGENYGSETVARGGLGGGLLILIAPTIVINGAIIDVSGQNGFVYESQLSSEGGGGGGGGGGVIVYSSPNITETNVTYKVGGGTGAPYRYDSEGPGGDGAAGYVLRLNPEA